MKIVNETDSNEYSSKTFNSLYINGLNRSFKIKNNVEEKKRMEILKNGIIGIKFTPIKKIFRYITKNCLKIN